MRKHGLRRRDAAVTSESKIEGSAEAVSIDTCHGRGAAFIDLIHQTLAAERKFPSLIRSDIGYFTQVGARREYIPTSSKYQQFNCFRNALNK